MPFVHVTMGKRLDAAAKRGLIDGIADEICAHTSTLPKNIYVFIHEMEPENLRQTAPSVVLHWTAMPDRTNEAKKLIMSGITALLAEVCSPDEYDQIAIVINDIPLASAMLGGVSRSDDPSK